MIKYVNAYRAGYKFNICKIGKEVYDNLSYWIKENFSDIEVQRPGITTDFELIHKNTLFTINGIVYDTTYINKKLYIRNATKNMLKSRVNSVGILSFLSYKDKFKKIKITPAMITGEPNFPLYNKTIITFNEKIDYPILVLCGYLVFETSDVFYRVSENSFALRLDKLNYIERLFEISKYRDIFYELNIPINNSVIDNFIATQDITIIKYLTHENSFIINLKLDEPPTLEKIYLERSTIPGLFFTETNPIYPLIGGYGKILDYVSTRVHDNRYKITCQDNVYNNYIFTKLPSNKVNFINNHRSPYKSHMLTQVYFLKFS